jgi:FLVCR family feline leukemia virus subgroup C receptor-related protein
MAAGPNGEDEDTTNGAEKPDYANMVPQVYPQRWVQLGYLSALALLSDWICFSVAAAPSTFEDTFHHSAAGLIDMFLFMNVASCFLVTDIVAKVGLQRAIQGAGALMTVGCWFRSGFSFLLPVANAVGLNDVASQLTATSTPGVVPYPFIVIGTLMVGAAQPFFQCTPPLLSATWFASDERATSTAVALNFNQIGIATAFLVGGAMATNTGGLEEYFGLMAVLCTLVSIGAFLQFKNLPPSPPSTSELEKLMAGEEEPQFFESVKIFFATPGFSRPLAAFVCSISVTNIVGVSCSFCYRKNVF